MWDGNGCGRDDGTVLYDNVHGAGPVATALEGVLHGLELPAPGRHGVVLLLGRVPEAAARGFVQEREELGVADGVQVVLFACEHHAVLAMLAKVQEGGRWFVWLREGDTGHCCC